MGQDVRGQRIDAAEDVAALLHCLDVQPVLAAKQNDDFNAVEGIQSHAALAEEAHVVLDVFRLEIFQGEVFHEELFEFLLDLFEGSSFHGFQDGAFLSTDDGGEFKKAWGILQGGAVGYGAGGETELMQRSTLKVEVKERHLPGLHFNVER
jgi:hypothetical protein